MSLTASTMLELGTKAPDFSLPDTDDKTVRLADFEASPALLVIFMCNHCPFVIHVADELAKLAKRYQQKGVAVVGISSNDALKHPDDGPERMKQERAARGYAFAYLHDESQEVAKAYRAACTPDFFVFDGKQQLAYRGQMDDSRPDSGIAVTGRDLCGALDASIAGNPVAAEQKPSMGCNIKWKAGNEPEYA
jgi:peroxiredoxin